LGYGSSVAPIPPIDDHGWNWQAHKLFKHRTKWDDDEERRLLGILPPVLQGEAQQVVQVAVTASQKVVQGETSALLDSLEAREAYTRIYKQAFKDATDELISVMWMLEMKREQRRRAYLLLLH
jgi:hypothetical protein